MSELGMALQSKLGSIDLQPAFLKQGQYLLYDTNLVVGLSPTRAEIGRNSGKVILVWEPLLLLQVEVSLECSEHVEELVLLTHQNIRLDALHLIVIVLEEISLVDVWIFINKLIHGEPVSHVDTNQGTSCTVITELTVFQAAAFAVFRESLFDHVGTVLLSN